MALGGPEVVLALLLSHRREAQLDLVRAEQLAAAVEVQLMLRLADDDVIGGGDLPRARGRARGQQASKTAPIDNASDA